MSDQTHGLGRREPIAEFVGMMAMSMAITALSVDIMLVALPDIAATFALHDANTQQFVVTVYMAAFATGHLVVGPLSDRIGRKPVLIGGFLVYAAGTVVAIVADSFTMLLLARVIQGLGASGPRVVAVAVVRDRYVGRAMSQIMSIVMMVFIVLPVIAPSLGSLLVMLGSWRPIFMFLLAFSLLVMAWIGLRLPETNPRTGAGVTPVPLGLAVMTILRSRETIGYTLSLGFIFGCLLTYIASAQQIFQDIYGIVTWFPAIFASVAGTMVLASLTNSLLVERVGMRRLSHGALISLVGTILIINVVHALVGVVPVALFVAFLAVCFYLVGIMLPNFNSMAMEPLGRIAGTGSSFVGFAMTGIGALLGGIVGQLYDGTAHPLFIGYAVYSVVSLLIVWVTERGKLMHATPQHNPTTA
ncbi:Bcr/CflA subfamily drug resistance transporter [Stappia sp. 22II-S9-Z10]|nr:Bcr/CflA subfamily drug resistance transporter [Stappia sp. 22II-S9-Z10]